MPQRPKAQMRSAIVSSARRLYAEGGAPNATVARIADEAGTSVGNVYKYFPDKQELFGSAIPEAVVAELKSLLSRRVGALGTHRDVGTLGPDHPYRRASEELLEFALQHRDELLFLLRHAEGTPYAGLPQSLVADLTRAAIRYAREAYPDLTIDAATRRTLRRIYRGWVDSIAAILAEERSESALRRATERYTTYHLAGLRALFSEARR